jgi:hypothetical protein
MALSEDRSVISSSVKLELKAKESEIQADVRI